MDQEKLIKYWVSSSDNDFRTMNNLYSSKDYHWSLFIGHLVLEKLLKATYIQTTGANNPPRTHDLLVLSDKAGIVTDDSKKDLLDLVTTFNISARYPDYKQSFYKKCTESYTSERIKEIKEMRTWLISILEKR